MLLSTALNVATASLHTSFSHMSNFETVLTKSGVANYVDAIAVRFVFKLFTIPQLMYAITHDVSSKHSARLKSREGTLLYDCALSPCTVAGPGFVKSPRVARVVTFVPGDLVLVLKPSLLVLSRSLLKSSPKTGLLAARAFAQTNCETWCILGRCPDSWILSATSNHFIFR